MDSQTDPEVDVGEVGANKLDEEAVLQAHARMAPFLPASPLHYSREFSCWLKLENLQQTGSFKVRGALNALLCGRQRGDTRSIICASAGNHAQGVAWAARKLGLRAITVMPANAAHNKVAGVRALGAKVILQGDAFQDARTHAIGLAREHGHRFVCAYDNPEVIAGQGTLACELSALKPDTVVVPVGGGGLAAGVLLALKDQGVRVVGVQVEGMDAMARVLAGKPQVEPRQDSIADGTRVHRPGQLTRKILAAVLDQLLTVSEAELTRGVTRLALADHVVAEGAGALAVAALGKLPDKLPGKRRGARLCAVVSGGNIDASMLAQLLTAAGGPNSSDTSSRSTSKAPEAIPTLQRNEIHTMRNFP